MRTARLLSRVMAAGVAVLVVDVAVGADHGPRSQIKPPRWQGRLFHVCQMKAKLICGTKANRTKASRVTTKKGRATMNTLIGLTLATLDAI